MRKYNWNYNRDPMSLFSYVKKISDNIENICESLRECDGDMYLSDVRNLHKMNYKLGNLVSQLKKEQEEEKENE